MAITNIECDYVCNCHDHPTREWDATPRKDWAGSLTQGATAMIHPTVWVWLSCPLPVVEKTTCAKKINLSFWRGGRYTLTLSLPRATIVAKLGYPLISIYSNRESLGNPRESREI